MAVVGRAVILLDCVRARLHVGVWRRGALDELRGSRGSLYFHDLYDFKRPFGKVMEIHPERVVQGAQGAGDMDKFGQVWTSFAWVEITPRGGVNTPGLTNQFSRKWHP